MCCAELLDETKFLITISAWDLIASKHTCITTFNYIYNYNKIPLCMFVRMFVCFIFINAQTKIRKVLAF